MFSHIFNPLQLHDKYINIFLKDHLILEASLPVQQLPVLSTPAVLEFLRVHASNLVKIRLVDSKQTKAVYLPVSWEKSPKCSREKTGSIAAHCINTDRDATAFNRAH